MNPAAAAAYHISVQNNMQKTSWGLPMAVTRAQVSTSSILHFTASSFTISGWYYSCSTSIYTVFCKKDTSQVTEAIYLCLEVDSTSNFNIQILLGGILQSYRVTGFTAQTGWTYFAITVSEVFQYSNITFYASNDAYTGQTASVPFRSESVTLNGKFGIDPTQSNNLLSFGCSFDKLGNCNKPLLGYFYETKIWSNQALTSAQLAFEVIFSSSCTGSCTVCALIDSTCFSSKSLDVVSVDLEQDVQALVDSNNANTVFYQGGTVTSGASDGDPIRIKNQGMLFSASSYLMSSTPFNLPQGLYVEAWIRFDLANQITTGKKQYIYEAQRNTFQFSIGLDYNLLQVTIGKARANYYVNWKGSTSWRYLGISLIRTSYDSVSYSSLGQGTTQVKMYVDNALVSTQIVNAIFEDDQSSTKSDRVGFNFQGVIRKFKISASQMCNQGQPSNSVSTSCSANGATTSCSICDKATNVCFTACGLNTIDNQCTQCNWKCKSCFSGVNTCTACATSSNLVGIAPTCNCAAGFVQVSNSCQACNSNCATCLDTTNSNCPVCSASSFLYQGKSCLQTCPYGYSPDYTSNMCHFDTTKLINPIYQVDYLNQGCSYSQYSTSSTCASCDATCYTCKGGSSSDCTSCDLGFYLSNGKCLVCDAAGMIVGSSGECVEVCGDGKNFGLLDCDDGNIVSGDGCSSSCEIEADWMCYGGSSTSADQCETSQLFIRSLESTPENNILLHFSKAAYIIDELSTDDLEIIIEKYDGTLITNFEASFSNMQEMPCETLYIKLEIKEFLKGLSQRSRVTINYKRSQKIFDTRLIELLQYSEAFTYIGKVFPEMHEQEKNAIQAMGILNNLLIILTIGITTFLAWKYDSSLQPAFLLFFGMQEILYTLLYNFDYPLDMKFFWKYYSWVQIEFQDMIPNTFSSYFMDLEQIQQGSYSDNYQFMNLVADSFVINNHLKIFAWAFYTTIFLLLQGLKKKIPPKIRENANNAFLFSSTISLFMCCLMPFGQTSFIEIQNIKKTLPFKLASVSSSFFMLATLFFFLYSITLIAIRSSSHYHNERFLKKYMSILKPFKPRQTSLLYYPIFCWKRFIQVIITALFITTPTIQALGVAILQLGFLCYVFFSRPYQSTYNNVLSMLSQLFPFLLSVYSLVFNQSTNDPQQAFNFGWGSMLMVSVYCVSFTAVAMIANVYHVLDKAAFAQRYSYELEEKVQATFKNIFGGKAAGNGGGLKALFGKKKTEAVEEQSQEPEKSKLNMFNLKNKEVDKSIEIKVDDDENDDLLGNYLKSPAQAEQQTPIKLSNNFKSPPGINNGLNLGNVLSASQRSFTKPQQKNFPPIDSHRPKINGPLNATPTQALNMFNGLPKPDDAEIDEDLSDPDEKNNPAVDLAGDPMNATSISKKKTKKVKKKVKTKKKKTNILGETIQGGNQIGQEGGEYLLM